MTAHEILHIIRNPWGWSEEEVRQARIAAAYLIEQQAAELAILKQRNPNGQRNPSEGDPCGRSCEGQAYRIELRQALAKNEQQAKEIEALKAVSREMVRVGMQQRNDLAHARNDISVMQAALRDADDYLSSDRFNEIGSGSILHRQMQDALTGK